jgi:hypothetical protein
MCEQKRKKIPIFLFANRARAQIEQQKEYP